MKELVLMGGAIGKEFAEYNIKCDPEAADIVFRSGVSTRIVPLDVTECCVVGEEFLAQLHREERSLPALLDRLIALWRAAYNAGPPILHDPLAVGLLTAPGLYRLEPMRVEVNLRANGPRGHTVCTPDPQSPIHVCTGVDYPGFLAHFESLILID